MDLTDICRSEARSYKNKWQHNSVRIATFNHYVWRNHLYLSSCCKEENTERATDNPEAMKEIGLCIVFSWHRRDNWMKNDGWYNLSFYVVPTDTIEIARATIFIIIILYCLLKWCFEWDPRQERGSWLGRSYIIIVRNDSFDFHISSKETSSKSTE